MSNEFGKLLKEYRKRAGLSIKKAAQGAGVSPGYWSNVEAGERAPFTSQRVVGAGVILNLSEEETDDLMRASLGVPRFDLRATLGAAVDRYGAAEVRAVLERVIAKRGK